MTQLHRTASLAVVILLLVQFAVAHQVFGDDTQDVKKALSDYDQAIARQDAAAHGRLLTDDYLLIDHEGKYWSKKEITDMVKSGEMRFEVAKSEKVTVRFYGSTAITTGDWIEKGVYKGEPFDRLTRFTTIFAKQDGAWRVVSDHVTNVKAP